MIAADIRPEMYKLLYERVIPSDEQKLYPGLQKVVRDMTRIMQNMGRDGVQDDIYWIVQETGVNAAKHGNGFSPEKTVNFRLYLNSEGTLTINVKDEGKGFELGKVPVPVETAETNLDDILEGIETSGRGLYVMKQLPIVESVETKPGKGDVYVNLKI